MLTEVEKESEATYCRFGRQDTTITLNKLQKTPPKSLYNPFQSPYRLARQTADFRHRNPNPDSFSRFLCHPHVNLFFVIPGPTEKIVG